MDGGSVIFQSSEPRFNGFLSETDLAADPHGRQRMLTGEFVHSRLRHLESFCHFIRLEQPHMPILRSCACVAGLLLVLDYTQPLEYVNTEVVDYLAWISYTSKEIEEIVRGV